MRTIALFLAVFLPCVRVVGSEPYVTAAPSGKFSIVQQYNTHPDSSEDGAFDAVLHFADASKPDAIIAAEPDHYVWPAVYYISPDEQWILRIQKTGSGENSAFLYRIESTGRVWRAAQALDDLAFRVATAELKLSRDACYHVGVRFISWDLPGNLIHLAIFWTPNDPPHTDVEQKIDYSLKDGKAVAR